MPRRAGFRKSGNALVLTCEPSPIRLTEGLSLSQDATVKIRIWNVKSGAVLHKLDSGKRRIRSLAFSPNSLQLASGGEGKHVHVWNVETGRQMVALPRETAKVFAVLFTGDDQLAAAGSDNLIRIWDVKNTNRCSAPRRTHRLSLDAGFLMLSRAY